ncbi:T9SS type A sorting domain-containing protein [Flavobacterium amnicola]|uniref:T9SS type A sorting domain-containing protein n=2 Tax=Flavobacterium amnicola TaxID=2506422 RepID=A0A4V1N276_9FLAO|nr:T9SS type A sorting domain-containing protein [Flavobacterium amnicola]
MKLLIIFVVQFLNKIQMKKIYLLVLTLIGVYVAQAQTVYSENMGVPTANTTVANYITGSAPATFQNGSPIVYSGTSGATSMRVTAPSTGYTGSSGGGNVFLSQTGNVGHFFRIDGINTSAYLTSGLQMSFGYITSVTTSQLILEKSTDGTNWTPITFTNNTNTSWNLVNVDPGQIPSSTTLSLRFTHPSTVAVPNTTQFRIDDIVVKNVSASCVLVPGAPTTACAATTLGIDTYTITIPYTGGGTAAYTVTPTTGVVGGDNPSTVAAGNITITGTNEGVNNSITITGGTCSFTIPVIAPTGGCKPINTLPYYESFNYTVGNVLTNEQKWTILNSGDDILLATGNLTYPGVTPVGNSVTWSGAGAEARTPFTSTTSGTIYSSNLVSITDLSNVTVDLTPTYFALFTDNTGASTNARIWLRNNAGQYQFGLSTDSTSANVTWSSNLYNSGTVQYLVLGYDFGTNTLALYENQATPAAPNVSVTPGAAFTNLGGFMLRQDLAASTPTIVFDELRISTTLPSLSRNDFNAIAGLRVYPNPANTVLNITSDSFATKNVEIFNVMGAKVLATQVTNAPVNVAGLTAGIYMVKVTEDGKTTTRKLVIE